MDAYSFTAAGNEYVAHEWLAAVLLHLVHAASGVNGLILFKALLVGMTAAILYRAARSAGATLAAAVPSLALGLFVAASRFYVRPHILAYLLTAAYLWIFLDTRRAGRGSRRLLLLIPLQLLWANVHGGGLLGLILLGAFSLGEAIEFLRDRAPARSGAPGDAARGPLFPILAAAGGLLVSLINPYGYRILLFPFRLVSLGAYMEAIYEWHPPYRVSYGPSTMFLAFMVMMPALLTSIVLTQRDRGRQGGHGWRRWSNHALAAAPGVILLAFLGLRLRGEDAWNEEAVSALVLALPALLALFCLLNLRTCRITENLLILALLILACRHSRAVADAALAGSVFLAAGLSRLRGAATRDVTVPGGRGAPGEPRQPLVPRRPRGWTPALLALVLLVSSGLVAARGYPYRFGGPVREEGLGLGSETPACAVDYIERAGISGNAFVSYSYGAMLIHRLHPQVKVNMDSRNEVYGEELYRGFVAALQSPEAMRRYLAGRDVDFFLLSYADPAASVGEYLLSSGEWAPVYFDARSFVLVRRASANESLIARDEYVLLRPAALGSTRVTPANAGLALREADRAAEQCPGSFFGHFYRSKALMALGRYAEALEASRAGAAVDPGNATAWADMGYAYAALGDRGKAIEMYEKALSLDPDHRAARENLRILKAGSAPGAP